MTTKRYFLLTVVLPVVLVLLTTTENGICRTPNPFALGKAIANPATLEMSNKAIYRRPQFTQAERAKVYDTNRHWLTGKVYDPGTGIEIKLNEKWDMGHKPGYEFWRAEKNARQSGKTSLEFRTEQKNLNNYRPELQSSNRSRRYEMPRTKITARPSPSPIAAQTLGRALGGIGVVLSAHEFYDTERRYRRGEFSAAARNRKHSFAGLAATAGTALLFAPEPVFTTTAGAAILALSAANQVPFEHQQKHHDALRRVEEQLDRELERARLRREEKVFEHSRIKIAAAERQRLRIQLATNDVRKRIGQH